MERHRIFCALRFIVAIKIICKTNSAKEQQQQQNQPVSKKKCSETVKKYIVRQSKVVKIISKLQKYKNGINWSVLLCFSCSFESYLYWKWTEKIYQKKNVVNQKQTQSLHAIETECEWSAGKLAKVNSLIVWVNTKKKLVRKVEMSKCGETQAQENLCFSMVNNKSVKFFRILLDKHAKKMCELQFNVMRWHLRSTCNAFFNHQIQKNTR